MSLDFENYFTKLGCPYWHEYKEQFKLFDFKDKAVVIVGGDCGSTCVYAYLHGAKSCIMYEAEAKLRDIARQVELELKLSFDIRGKWEGNEYPDADIFLIDCEGCEEKLDIDLVTKKYKQVGIAVHEWTKNRVELLQKLAKYSYRLVYVTADGKELYFALTT